MRGRFRHSIVFLLGLVGFVTSFGAHVVAVNLPIYAKQVGAGLAAIGVLIAMYDFAELFAKPVFGWVADRRGLKATMLVGLAFFFPSLAGLSVRTASIACRDSIPAGTRGGRIVNYLSGFARGGLR
jgi:MFS family permease